MRRNPPPRSVSPAPPPVPLTPELQELLSFGLDYELAQKLIQLLGPFILALLELLRARQSQSPLPLSGALDCCDRCCQIGHELSQSVCLVLEHCSDVCQSYPDADQAGWVTATRDHIMRALVMLEMYGMIVTPTPATPAPTTPAPAPPAVPTTPAGPPRRR